MTPPAEKLASSLEALRALQERGVAAIRAADLARTDRERLVRHRFLTPATEPCPRSFSSGRPADATGSPRCSTACRCWTSAPRCPLPATSWTSTVCARSACPPRSLRARLASSASVRSTRGRRSLWCATRQTCWLASSRRAAPRWPGGWAAAFRDAGRDRMADELAAAMRDGNGRIGRLLMNLMLTAAGYPWTVIPVERRDAGCRCARSPGPPAVVPPGVRRHT